jgi:hypothetical protein
MKKSAAFLMITPGVEYSKQKPCSPFSTSSPLSSFVLSSLVSLVLSSLVSLVLSSLVSLVLSSFVSLRSSLASPALRRTLVGSRSLSAFLQLATESDQNALALLSKPVHFGTDPDPDPAIFVSDL